MAILTPTSEQFAVLDRIRDTVHPDQGDIPSFIFTDPEVYRLEMERIYQKVWLFVGHESEVPQRGDYVTRDMGEQPVIVTRGEDDQVRVLLNVCRHRGMRIARSDLGNASHFRCPYHGFTYTYCGELTGVPFQRDAYGEGMDKAQFHLIEARSESYKGMIFATWNREGPSLTEFLGSMAWYLDILIGRADMEVLGPPQKWVIPTAWKWPPENFVSDAYHTAYTHASIPKLNLVAGLGFAKDGYHVCAGGGHGLGIGIQKDGQPYPEELEPEYRQHLTEDQLAIFKEVKNLHGTVFPNLSFLIPTAIHWGDKQIWNTTVRLWQPRGPRQVEVYSWSLVEKSAPQWWKDASRIAYIQTFGSSGMLEQDDTENWEFQTSNSDALLPQAEEMVYNYHMGLGSEPMKDFPGPGRVWNGKFNEENARKFYARWRDLMLADS